MSSQTITVTLRSMSEPNYILVMDIDNEYNVQIIEINHRSNYAHPDEISKKTDVLCMRDLIKLFIYEKHNNSDFVLIG